MNETPFFFPNGPYNLFGILHEPEVEPNGESFVFCHPFAEEKLWSHRVFVNFARELAKIGYTVLRFDYMGHGDSDGKFEESTIETRLSDIKCAIKLLRKRTNCKINLVGLRLGATLASLVAEDEPSIEKLILWDPIINGSAYMRKLLRINIATQSAVYKEVRFNTEDLIQKMNSGDTVNIDGYEVSQDLYNQIRKVDLLNGTKRFHGRALLIQISKKECKYNKRFHGRALLIQISKKECKYNKNIDSLKMLYSICQISLAIEDYFWTEIRAYYYKCNNLFDITLKWLINNGKLQKDSKI
jgi:exosortase A-associated hydrolase 2